MVFGKIEVEIEIELVIGGVTLALRHMCVLVMAEVYGLKVVFKVFKVAEVEV